MLVSHAQGEAKIWYFGINAGLDFNSGAPVVLTNGQLVTDEGCATISNSSGQLLFYTDGVTVYNKNHVVMVNGNGLMGHTSSAQSATIVPKPGSSNLYYIFTTAVEHDPNGFRYSIVDINLDNGNGAVTTDKNILVYTPTIEGLGITKHANGSDYWIISHEWNSNNFRTYILTSSGLNTTPIISSIGSPILDIDFFHAAGMIKASPSGSKLAITSAFNFAELFNFDNSTGILSNPTLLLQDDAYGIAFSPDESKLYISSTLAGLYQFNLLATDIPASSIVIASGTGIGQLQLATDNKIYIAGYDSPKLSVINDPNLLGNNCNIQFNTLDLSGKISRLGLPSFNQSFFFSPAIQLTNTCVNQNTTFQFSTNQTIISATWDFGDGTSSTTINPTHNYSAPGTYTVTINVVTTNGTGSNTRNIVVYAQPSLLSNLVSLKQCDDNQDGFSSFNLEESKSLLVANTVGLTFTYYETATEAQNSSNPISNLSAYTNQTVNNDIIYVRVENTNGCYKVAQLNLVVSTTSIPTSFLIIDNECDDLVSGSAIDGIATFDFSNATSQIQALFPSGQQLVITYYKNLVDALAEQNSITNISNYSNIGYPNSQDIFVRVDSQINNECLGLGHHITLKVDPIPIVQSQIIKHCDDDQDGIFGFDTTNIQTTLLNGINNVIVSYYDQNGLALSSPLPNPFVTSSQIINVKVENNYGKHCIYNSTIQFVVDDLPDSFFIPTPLTNFCDNESDPIFQDGIYPFDTSTFQSSIVGNQTGMIVHYYDSNNTILPSPLPNPFNSTSQNIRVEITNPNNITCKANGFISLVVHPIPKIYLTGNELICSDNPNFTKIINAGLIDASTVNNFSYTWYFNGVLISNANQYSLIINNAGIYTVAVKNVFGCIRTRTITVTTSNIAIINTIEVNDNSDDNSILIIVSGNGNYSYSLDGMNFQNDNFFTNIMPGFYDVFVKDNNGCGIITREVSVLGIPKHFTPNGDGFNDYWYIKGFNGDYNSKGIIYIYDRYGKLLKQMKPNSHGWDGTYNGQIMPSEDYWYSIQFDNGRNIKGHFSLKR